jgi:hypothetical protein
MMPYGFRQYRRSDNHKLTLACVAVLLSALVHVILMCVFADWRFTDASGLASKRREWAALDRVPPMRVDTMRADPMRVGEKVLGERDTPSRGPIEVSEQVQALSQSASPALMAPPAVPRESVVPGVPVLSSKAPPEHVESTPWMPRQEIAQIFDRTVQDDVAALPRREIPLIERVPRAPDLVPSIDLTERRFGRDPEPPKPSKGADIFDTETVKGTYKTPASTGSSPSGLSKEGTEARFGLQPGDKDKRLADDTAAQAERLKKQTTEAAKQPASNALSEEERKAREAQAQIEALQDTIDYIPIDDLLAVGLETYRDPQEPGRVYFRIGIQPRQDKSVPVIAKDIVWVQDVSASITEERLVFCKRGMAAALETMNPNDRFAVIGFRESFSSCFPVWTAVTPDSKKTAADFVSAMHSFGQSALFSRCSSFRAIRSAP